MKVLIFKSADHAIERVSNHVINQLQQKPSSVLGLATGGTMIPVYEKLVQSFQDGKVSFANATSFNLDEYIGLDADHPCSYHKFMNDCLFSHTDMDASRAHLPFGNTADPEAEANRYEALIDNSGGIDLQLLGIGANGHIGFNEPSSSLRSLTRVKTLINETREANQRFFEPPSEPPKYSITMGIETILRSREVVVLATGQHKSGAVADMVEGALGAYCPATSLQFHRNATVVLDEDAAGDLKLRDYYFQVHPDGKEYPIV